MYVFFTLFLQAIDKLDALLSDYRGNSNWQFCVLVATVDAELCYLTTSDTQFPAGILDGVW